MDLYRKVRLACAEGMSQREAARHFNISRDSVAKMMAFSVPPGYRRTAPVKRPKLDAFTGIIDGWLEGDREVHRKQRHTAKRVFERLREEHGFTGGYTIVKDYMRQRERRSREMFVPLAHPPGHAQADFGEAVVVIGGVEQKAHFFVLDLPRSDACYVRAYPAATAEAWVDGHVQAFAFFGKVPASVLYDNDRCLVAKILPDGTRQRATLFSGFLSHYLFRDRYGRPGKGNVEGLVGYSRRNFMVPVPRFASWDAFNAYLEEQCRRRQADVLRGQSKTIGERLVRDLAAMADLPAAAFDACDQATGRVSSQALVRYKTNDYSVPVAYGHRDIWIKAAPARPSQRPDHPSQDWPCGPMRHGTRQLFGERARHGAKHPKPGRVLRRHVAGFYSAVDSEFCGTEKHPYELYLDLNAIEHRRTKVRTPKTNGFVERFNGTVLEEFFRVKMRETFYETVEALQADLDAWLFHYNTERPHMGYRNMGRRPIETVMSFVSQEG